MIKVRARLDITNVPPILVNEKRCDLCGACVGVCPPDVMVMTDRSLKIMDGCIKCGFCIQVCPLEALAWNESPALEVLSAGEEGGDGRG